MTANHVPTGREGMPLRERAVELVRENPDDPWLAMAQVAAESGRDYGALLALLTTLVIGDPTYALSAANRHVARMLGDETVLGYAMTAIEFAEAVKREAPL